MVKCPSSFYLFAKLLRYTRMLPKISNVPDNLLQNSTFRIFVEKYIEYLFPSEETTKHFWNQTQTPDRQLSHKRTDRTKWNVDVPFCVCVFQSMDRIRIDKRLISVFLFSWNRHWRDRVVLMFINSIFDTRRVNTLASEFNPR